MSFHLSASFYGGDWLEARAQRQSPREQTQLDPLTLEPLRQVPSKTQLVLERCTPRLALVPRKHGGWHCKPLSDSYSSILFCCRRHHHHDKRRRRYRSGYSWSKRIILLCSGSSVAFLGSSIMPSVGLVLNETRALHPLRR